VVRFASLSAPWSHLLKLEQSGAADIIIRRVCGVCWPARAPSLTGFALPCSFSAAVADAVPLRIRQLDAAQFLYLSVVNSLLHHIAAHFCRNT